MTAASDYHAARPAFQNINKPSADYFLSKWHCLRRWMSARNGGLCTTSDSGRPGLPSTGSDQLVILFMRTHGKARNQDFVAPAP
jgi:hypothetical protein